MSGRVPCRDWHAVATQVPSVVERAETCHDEWSWPCGRQSHNAALAYAASYTDSSHVSLAWFRSVAMLYSMGRARNHVSTETQAVDPGGATVGVSLSAVSERPAGDASERIEFIKQIRNSQSTRSQMSDVNDLYNHC